MLEYKLLDKMMLEHTFCLTPAKLLADSTLAPVGSPARAVQQKCPTIAV